MTKKTKILSICSVAGFLLLSFTIEALVGNWGPNTRSIFSVLWDDELAGIIWPIVFILALIIYLFLRKKDHTGLDVIKKTLWVVFVVLGLASLAYSLLLWILIMFVA